VVADVDDFADADVQSRRGYSFFSLNKFNKIILTVDTVKYVTEIFDCINIVLTEYFCTYKCMVNDLIQG